MIPSCPQSARPRWITATFSTVQAKSIASTRTRTTKGADPTRTLTNRLGLVILREQDGRDRQLARPAERAGRERVVHLLGVEPGVWTWS